ncbi:hypothetical protein L0337_43770 [candidate division KSB1 bacterium]|nr:hypothetical protein [candidate division KSB1 bacterium]
MHTTMTKLSTALAAIRHNRLAVLIGPLFVFIFVACEPDFKTNTKSQPFLTIENGQFDVNAIIIDDSTDLNTSARGSGSFAFDYKGDISGRFSVSGTLVFNQATNDAAGAVVEQFEDPVAGIPAEALSLVGFHPTGNGKADIIVLGTKSQASPSPFKAGDIHGIGPSGSFNGLFLSGIAIADFWAGEKNLIDASDRAFVFTAGFIRFDSRDSTHVTGSFATTTDPNR